MLVYSFLMVLLFGLVRSFADQVPCCNKTSPYVYSLGEETPQSIHPSGNITWVTSQNFPVLNRLSLRRVTLAVNGVREPHWHLNANELTYCLSGSVRVTVFGHDAEYSTFIMHAGQLFFIPSGYFHHIENIDNETEAELISAFSHELPTEINLSSAISAMSDSVLGNTFQLRSSAFSTLRKRTRSKMNPTKIGTMSAQSDDIDFRAEQHVSRFKFDIEKMTPPVQTPEGVIKTAKKAFWPVLEDIAMFSLRVSTAGMRELHWHPRTAEMGYVVRGRARMTILSPDGSVNTYTLQPGDVYFVPAAYPHQIENIGEGADEDIFFLIFFDRETPQDIGYTAAVSAYSRQVLAASLQCSVKQLPPIPFQPKDLKIVKRINPVDD